MGVSYRATMKDREDIKQGVPSNNEDELGIRELERLHRLE